MSETPPTPVQEFRVEDLPWQVQQMMTALTALVLQSGGEVTIQPGFVEKTYGYWLNMVSDPDDPMGNPIVITAHKKQRH